MFKSLVWLTIAVAVTSLLGCNADSILRGEYGSHTDLKVTQFNGPSSQTYYRGQVLEFVLSFSSSVTAEPGLALPLTIGGLSRQASYHLGSGTNTLVFRYVVQTGDVDSDGISVAENFELASGTLSLPVKDWSQVLVDGQALIVTKPSTQTFYRQETIAFTVNFPDPVTVSGVPRLPITVGGEQRYANYTSGSGTADLIFTYEVLPTDSEAADIEVSTSLDPNAATMNYSTGSPVTDFSVVDNSDSVVRVDTTELKAWLVPTSSPILEEGQGSAQFTVSLSAAAPKPLEIGFYVIGEATPEVDHTLSSGTVTVPEGQTSVSRSFLIIDDMDDEDEERLAVILSPASLVTIDSKMYNLWFHLRDNDPSLSSVSTAQFAVSDTYFCAVMSDGALRCYGSSSYGALGIPGGGGSLQLTTIIASQVSSVDVQKSNGFNHTCAVMTDGELRCWGNNFAGKLGTGDYNDYLTPVSVISSGASQVALATGHTCAVMTDGELQCWGDNTNGALGIGNTTSSNTPVSVLASGVAMVDVGGSDHTCALMTDGELKCWGENSYGQLGTGDTTTSLTPISVISSNVGDFAVGAGHTCAVMTSGELRCWGRGDLGALGTGGASDVLTPTTVISSGVSKVYASLFTCALLNSGAYKCWGDNWAGQLGTGDAENRFTPALVVSEDVVNASVASRKNCIQYSSGAVACAGAGSAGKVIDTKLPVWSLAENSTDLVVGGRHGCSVTVDNDLQCWGENSDGQLALGDQVTRYAPFHILSDFAASVDIGVKHSCVVLTTGELKCAGNNDYGQLGKGNLISSLSLTPVMSSGVVSVSVAGGHSCAVLENGELHCWGYNSNGQIGVGDTSNRLTPVRILESSVTSVVTSTYYTCAVSSGGELYCWGKNSDSQLGDGSTTDRHTPVKIFSSGIKQVGLGSFHACVLTTSGEVKCWGRNSDGQLGDGSTTNSSTAISVISSGITNISLGGTHSCAVDSGGALKCWGNNFYGQLGTGDSVDVATPITIIASGAEQAACGSTHTCVRLSDGRVKCWGSSLDGNFGMGTDATNVSTEFVPIYGLHP